jgi:hypothetical protein
MRNGLVSIAGGLAVALICPLVAPAQTQAPAKTPKAAQSSAPPDLSGVWMRDAPPATGTQYWVMKFNLDEPPMTPWGQEQFKMHKSSFGDHPYGLEETNDPVLRGCFPPGVPRVYLHPFPFQFVQASDEVVMLFEVDSLRRQIYTDGRGHDTALVPLWMGDSIGHWEGDTLVVDTVNFNDKTWVDRIGHPHSDALHVVERFRRTAHDHLVIDITIEDPKAYTKPWGTRLEFKLQPTWRLTEQFCEDYDTFRPLEQKETAPDK